MIKKARLEPINSKNLSVAQKFESKLIPEGSHGKNRLSPDEEQLIQQVISCEYHANKRITFAFMFTQIKQAFDNANKSHPEREKLVLPCKNTVRKRFTELKRLRVRIRAREGQKK